MKSYYNTNREEGIDLFFSRLSALNQQDLILYFFRVNPHKKFSPHIIQRRLFKNTPITSIRRALTNLTDADLIEKTDHMVMGTYGKQVHTCQYKSKRAQLKLF